jgi:hypothetical protein
MADLKISQLNSLAGASLASADVLAVVDTSASETKKITSVELVRYGYGLISADALDGDIIEPASTSARGTVQLSDSIASTSTSLAATANAVKTAYDAASGALSASGGTITGSLVITADLTVQGTTTTIDTTTLVVKDKNIEMGAVTSPTDVTADGGGITLKGTTDKTINWIDSTDAWTFSEHIDLAAGKEIYIAGASVLNATTLGSGVVSSSLTSVGTIGTGTWQGTAVGTGYGGTGQTTYTDGQLLIGKTDGTLAKATLTAGTNVTITNGDGAITIAASGGASGVTAVTASSPLASSGGTTPDISIQDGTTAQKGAVQLEDSTSSTSTTTAATPNSVKSVYDLANAALPKSGGTMTGAITFNSGQAYPQIPANSQTSAYVLVAGDAGKHINITTGGVTVNTSVFATGDAVSIYNNSGSDQTITQGTSVTMRHAGTADTGNRTLAQYGVATILCVGSNTFVISGAGLS